MRRPILAGALAAAVLLLAGGCGGSDDGYFDQLRKTRGRAKKMVQIEPIRQCIQAFWATKGRYPKDLDELKKAYPQVPDPPEGMKYDYNPKTGEIKVMSEK